MKKFGLYIFAFIAFLALGIFFFYNQKKADQAPQMNGANGENFEQFYDKFLTDSTFQVSRIIFPLEGLPAHASQDTIDNGFYWDEEDWVVHKKIDYDELGYTQKFQAMDFLIIETVHINGQGMAAQRRFQQDKDGRWQLIYYADVNRIK